MADFSTETVKTERIDLEWYIGTENMLANCEGIVKNTIPIQYGQVRLYRKGDILISNIRPYLRKIWLATRDGGCSTDVNVIHSKGREFSSELLYYALSQDAFFDYIMSNAIGTKMPRGDKDVIRNFEFDLPTKKDGQQKIVSGFSEISNYIDVVQKLVSKYEVIKKATVNLLLKQKQGWRNVKLGDVLKVCHGKCQHLVESEAGLFPILATSGEIGRANQFLYDKPSVLIGRKGTIDKPQYIETPFWTIDTLFYTKIADGYIPKFVFYLCQTIDWASLNEASGVPSLSANRIESIEVCVPQNMREQKRIVAALDSIDNTLKGLKAQFEKSQDIKHGMMEYFFG